MLNDGDGNDIVAGEGANRSSITTEQVNSADLAAIANDTISLSVSNAGASKSGTVIVYIR